MENWIDGMMEEWNDADLNQHLIFLSSSEQPLLRYGSGLMKMSL